MSVQTTIHAADEPAWRRRLGSGANNRAWALSEQPARSPTEDREMLTAAHAAMYLWGSIGTADNVALAQLLLGHVHALLGSSEHATYFAESAHRHLSSGNPPPWSLALANAVRANAACAAGNTALHEKAYREAQVAMSLISDAEEHKIVQATMQVIPKPASRKQSIG